MTPINQVSQATHPERVFTHSGISYKSKNREVLFSREAKEELARLIWELQNDMKWEDLNEPIVELTTEVWQAVVDAMITEGKWKQMAKKFMKRYSKAIKKPDKMSEKQEQKVTEKVQKYTHEPYIHVYIVLESGERLLVPLIVRKVGEVDDILKRFASRFSMSASLKAISK